MNLKSILMITALSAFALGCKEVDLLHPYGEDDGKGPGPVSDVRVRNWYGAATLSYNLPADEDLSYVKATFIGTDGKNREMRASGYVDSLVLEGFGDTRDYEIELRAYDKFENPSEPVVVTVTPTTPPIQLVFESLSWEVDFGGFLINFKNETKADIGIFVTSFDNVSNEMSYYDVYYTEKSSGVYPVRGLPDKENQFGIYIQDHWGNKSETLEFTTTPLREDDLDKSKFMLVDPGFVHGDLPANQWDATPKNLWNEVIDNWDYGHTRWPVEFPHRFTVDLGVEAKMSRIKTWQRAGDDVRWQHGAWRIFNIYGCTELPDNSNSDPHEGWTLIGSFESVKPSGLPIGQVSDEDIQLLNEGEEFAFDRQAPVVRYLRFEILGVHSQMKLSCMSEIRLWGQIEKDSDNQ